jgi:hypothetical protein
MVVKQAEGDILLSPDAEGWMMGSYTKVGSGGQGGAIISSPGKPS